MREVTISIYKLDELPERARNKAIYNLSDVNVNSCWWEVTYEDIKTIGCEALSFDIDKKQIDFKLTVPFEKCISLIKENHGAVCSTHRIATQLEYNYNNIKDDPECINNSIIRAKQDLLTLRLQKNLGIEYLNMLSEGYDHLTSTESIIETIKTNGYEFTEEGELWND